MSAQPPAAPENDVSALRDDYRVPSDRESLGRMVRHAWVEWAREQVAPKPSWLVPWEGLSEPDREVDRRIGEALYLAGFINGQADLAASVAERVRVVEGERDAANVHAIECERIGIEAIEARLMETARAEAAEAANELLRKGIEALCDPSNDGPRPYAVPIDGDVLLAVDVEHLRALLAGGAS